MDGRGKNPTTIIGKVNKLAFGDHAREYVRLLWAL
jgi:hypothetical protein